jgi:thiol-disulfide isomerase/thioredoxin
MRFHLFILLGIFPLSTFAQHLKSKPDSSWIVIHSPDTADIAVYDLIPFCHQQVSHFPAVMGGFAIDRPVTAYYAGKTYFQIIIIPGDTLHIHVQQDTLAFDGKSAGINRFLQLKKREFGDYTMNTKVGAVSNDTMSIDAAVKQINEYEATQATWLDKYHTLPAWFIQSEKAHYRIEGSLYQILSANKRKVPLDLTGIDTLLNESGKFLYADQIYHYLLDSYLAKRFPGCNLTAKYKETSAHLNEVIKDPYIREVYKCNWITMLLSSSNNLRDWQEKNKMWNDVNIKDAALKTLVNTAFAERKTYLESPACLKSGDAIPVFSVISESGKNATQEDLKGSWTYLTIWGTWCEACRNEIPDKNKLADTYKDVKVINICAGSKEPEWRKMIPQLHGLNLYADKAASEQLDDAFKINGYPHHVLISPNGKIYENGTSAPLDIPLILDKLLAETLVTTRPD